MNTKNILVGLLASTLALGGCNDFLDTMPDKRMELSDTEKVRGLMVSAYPEVHPMGMLESRTDNIDDNGRQFGEGDLIDRESYRWLDLTGIVHDSSKWMWDWNYTRGIATANQALAALDRLPASAESDAIRGEALMVRAWCHFNLVNYFAQAYNSKTSATDLGVPYVTEPETKIGVLYPRLTVKETYEMIARDIQAALPLINDAIYKPGAIKYHFNSRAAAAFAAQFYLYYEQWAEAKKYATVALGDNPALGLRNLKPYAVFNTGKEVTLAFASVSERANLMLQNNTSLYARRYKGLRFGHSARIAKETFHSAFPGGALSDFSPLVRNWTANPENQRFIYKYEEGWQVTDKRSGIGVPRTIAMVFTTDKALLVRAEANNMLKLYDEAAADLSMYYVSKGASSASAEQISQFYNIPDDYESLTPDLVDRYRTKLEGICKPLDPHFGLEKGMQYNIAQAVLHARRIETLWEGARWDDIKRYRIAIKHNIPDEGVIELGKDDLRKAMQIPEANVSAGLQPNPR